jgi:hypothetical protein
MRKLYKRLKEEIRAMIAPFLFFFLSLHLVAFVRVLMLQGTGITLETSTSVTLAALILGKAVLIADVLPFINRFPDKPLVYNVAWKTVIYFLVAMLFHYLERLVDHWRETGGLIAANNPHDRQFRELPLLCCFTKNAVYSSIHHRPPFAANS